MIKRTCTLQAGITCLLALFLSGCYAPLPLMAPEHVIQNHIMSFDNDLYVGPSDAGIFAVLLDLDATPDVRHGQVEIFSGHVADGVTMERLHAYLAADIEDNGGVLRRWTYTPPIVAVVEGASDEEIDVAVQAVQILNMYLPSDWQIDFTDEPAKRNRSKYGHIVIDFAPHSTWPYATDPNHTLGLAVWPLGSQTTWAKVFIDPISTDMLTTTLHELLHTLGRGHVSAMDFPESIMNPNSNGSVGDRLHDVDQDALLAVYGYMTAGATASDIYEDLGEWADEDYSIEARMSIGNEVSDIMAMLGDDPDLEDQIIFFGTNYRNGLIRPWAWGDEPMMHLAENRVLDYDVRWDGRIVGLEPGSLDAMAGNTTLEVGLHTLDGTIYFHEFEEWEEPDDTGRMGTGNSSSLDLTFPIIVRGNTFIQTTEPETGIVTGAFVGMIHEGMIGTLHHDKVVGAFGGVRD